VFGVEVDGSFSDIQGHLNSIVVPCILAPGCDADVDWLVTTRARLGYAFDNIMPFVTGGLAFGGVKGTFDSPACTCSVDDIPFGYTLGGGVEWAINDSWSAKAEYLYVNLGKPDIDGDPVFVRVNDYDFSIVRAGFNYNF
jgi:outer membrane immunogenic protein